MTDNFTILEKTSPLKDNEVVSLKNELKLMTDNIPFIENK